MDQSKQSAAVVTQDDIAQKLHHLGLECGTIVLVHSSLSSFGHVQGGADAVIDALIETVSPGGTVLVPTLTGSETLSIKNPPFFDPATTPCWTGCIPEYFRQRSQAVRSLHPTHSVAAIGAQAHALTKGHEYSITPCGPDSPYGRLAQAGGVILFLGVTHSCNTTFHYVEESVGVSYHMQPGLAAAQVVKNGQTHTIHVMLHRYGTERDFERLEPVFRERGIQRDTQIGQAQVRMIDAGRMVELTRQALLQDPTLLLARDST